MALLRGERADFMPVAFEVMKDVLFPGERYDNGPDGDPYGTGPDAWGVLWTRLGPNPAMDGMTVARDFQLFDDISEWKGHVKFPDLDHMPLADIFGGMCAEMHVSPEADVVSCLFLSGQFERMNQLIGMENALCAFYEYPDETKEFFEAMCRYKLKCIDKAVELLHPDVIHLHDDWGTNQNMFFSPEIWREFIKPLERRYVERIHEAGALYIHHSCGYITQIVPDLAEIGVDAIEPVMMQNNVDQILDQYGDKITVMGGIDNQMIDIPESTEDQIRAEVRRAMDAYGHRGRYIPFYIATREDKRQIFMDEVRRYGADFFSRGC